MSAPPAWLGVRALSLSRVQLSAAPWTVCSPPGSSLHGILQAGILEWVAVSSSRGSPRPRDQTRVPVSPALAGRFSTTEPPRKPSLFGHLSPNCDSSSSQGGVGLHTAPPGAGWAMTGCQELPKDSKPQRPRQSRLESLCSRPFPPGPEAISRVPCRNHRADLRPDTLIPLLPSDLTSRPRQWSWNTRHSAVPRWPTCTRPAC